MRKIIILEDNRVHFEELLVKILENTSFTVSEIIPDIYEAFLDFSEFDSTLTFDHYDLNFDLLVDLYKCIRNENRKEIFEKLFNDLEISSSSYIILDISLKSLNDDEGLQFYAFLLNKKYDTEKIFITSVTDIQTANSQIKELGMSFELIEKNYFLKEGSLTYAIEVCNRLK